MNSCFTAQHHSSKLLLKKQMPESTKQSLMSMMKQIMQKSCMHNDELYYIAEQSVEDSLMEKQQVPESSKHQKPISSQLAQLNINSHKGAHKKMNYEPQQTNLQVEHEFSKLIQITERCVNYYNNFLTQKNTELQIIQKAFNDLNNNLDSAFQDMVSELVKKQSELKEFLAKKYRDIVVLRQDQDACLKQALTKIKEVHLTRLISKEHANPQKTPQSENDLEQTISQAGPENSVQLSVQLHSYASTLNQFYSLMEQIEKSNFKQMVEESVNFINNLVSEEIRGTLYERIPTRLTEKRMIRENSKDFLLQSPEASFNLKSDHFGILDIDSFTKLLFEPEQRLENQTLNKYPPSPSNNQNSQPHSQSQKVLNILNQMELKNAQVPNNPQNPEEPIRKLVRQFESSKQCSSGDFTKKQPHRFILCSPQREQSNNPPLKKQSNNYLNAQKQNQLQLIKKISNQQSNRSAKIKSYLVTFQTSESKPSQSPYDKKSILKSQSKNSKSPSKLSRTPTKSNKSGQKKVLSSIAGNGSNQAKLKSSQQTTLKSSRTCTYVSQFKINSGRRQSLISHK